MSSVGLHAVEDIITFLTSGWVAANTDSYKPLIINALEVPWQSLDFGVSDILYVKNNAETIDTGFYALEFYHRTLCNIEVMTGRLGNQKAGLAHFTKLVDETMRIIKANSRLSGYAFTVVSSSSPRYNKDRKIYSCNVEVKQLRVKTS